MERSNDSPSKPLPGELPRDEKGSYMDTGSACDDVHIVTTSDYEGAALCLAEAFGVDEVARYLIDTPDRSHWNEKDKWNLHVEIMKYITYAHCMRGLVTTIGPNYDSVALWMPPNSNMDDVWTFFFSGLWRLYYKLSREGRRRFFQEFGPLLHSTKKSILGEREHESYYLVYIGTKPSARGKGYAKRLIEDIAVRKADQEGAACYLESSNVCNLKLYKRLGFRVIKQIKLKKGSSTNGECDVPLDIMVREPVIIKEKNVPMKRTLEASATSLEMGAKSYPRPALLRFASLSASAVSTGLNVPKRSAGITNLPRSKSHANISILPDSMNTDKFNRPLSANAVPEWDLFQGCKLYKMVKPEETTVQ